MKKGPLTSIGRLKGSGGGVPNHATYVTQSLGSRWCIKSSLLVVDVKG